MGRPLPHRNRRPRDQPLESQCRNPTCSDGGQHTVCPTLMNAAESMLLLRRSRDRCQPQLAQNHIEPLPQTAMIAVGRQPICDRDQMTFVARIPAPRDAALVVQRRSADKRRRPSRLVDSSTAGAARRPSFICRAARPRLDEHRPRTDGLRPLHRRVGQQGRPTKFHWPLRPRWRCSSARTP